MHLGPEVLADKTGSAGRRDRRWVPSPSSPAGQCPAAPAACQRISKSTHFMILVTCLRQRGERLTMGKPRLFHTCNSIDVSADVQTPLGPLSKLPRLRLICSLAVRCASACSV